MTQNNSLSTHSISINCNAMAMGCFLAIMMSCNTIRPTQITQPRSPFSQVFPRTAERLRLQQLHKELIQACTTSNVKLAQNLIDQGAEVNRSGKNGPPALIVLAKSVFKPTNQQTPRQDDPRTAIATLLLRAGADPNTTDYAGRTALSEELNKNIEDINIDLVNELLKKGANPDYGNKKETVLINLLRSKGRILWNSGFVCNLVELLLRYGASINGSIESGQTALMFAISGETSSVIKFLLDAGADPRVADNRKRTALHHHTQHIGMNLNNMGSPWMNSDDPIIALLIRYGADPNATTRDNLTPLMSAHRNLEYEMRTKADDTVKKILFLTKSFVEHGALLTPDQRDWYQNKLWAQPLLAQFDNETFALSAQEICNFIEASDLPQDLVNLIWRLGDFPEEHKPALTAAHHNDSPATPAQVLAISIDRITPLIGDLLGYILFGL